MESVNLEYQVFMARNDKKAQEELLLAYMPFIKKQASLYDTLGIEYDDRLSIAMIAFLSTIRQYEENRGSFIKLAKLNIKSRLIDEYRRKKRYDIHMMQEDQLGVGLNPSEEKAIYQYDREQERQMLNEEIKAFAEDLILYDLTFVELVRVSPKQERAKRQCSMLAKEVMKEEKMRCDFLRTKRLPQSELSKRFGISVKTIEKHRKYIASLVVLLAGDYPGIRGFLPG